VPPPARVFEGPGDSLIPFSANAFHFQQIYDGAVLAPRSASIQDIAFRRGSDLVNQTKTFSSYTLNKMTVQMGSTTVWPSNMALTFAQNITTGMATVFSGTLVLPAQGVSFGPGPFNIQIKFARPFLYTRQLDHLILDIVVPGKNTANNTYYADMVTGARGGSIRSYGVGGKLKGSPYLIISTGAGALEPGGQVILEASNLTKVYPVLAAFGFSDSQFGPVALPWDLKALGAPSNFLHTSLDLLFPITIKKMSAFYGGVANFGIPMNPALAGAKIYGQGIVVDAASNKLGLVFSNGIEYQIGGKIVAPFKSLYSPDSTAGTGIYPHLTAGNITGGLVTRFTGTFQ
jgi:hypothetical protein